MILTAEQINQLKEVINETLNTLYVNDILLLNRRGLERSITFRFGLYFYNLTRNIDWISDLDIDLEYNKNGEGIKATARRPRGVQPDFILHRRNLNDNNALIIEFKGWWNNYDRIIDRNKIEDFVNQESTYRYGLGVLIELNQENFSTEYLIDYETD